MEIRRGAGFADLAMAVRVGYGGKVQQLAHGLVLQRQAVRQQDGGSGLLVMDLIDMVSVRDWMLSRAKAFGSRENFPETVDMVLKCLRYADTASPNAANVRRGSQVPSSSSFKKEMSGGF